MQTRDPALKQGSLLKPEKQRCEVLSDPDAGPSDERCLRVPRSRRRYTGRPWPSAAIGLRDRLRRATKLCLHGLVITQRPQYRLSIVIHPVRSHHPEHPAAFASSKIAKNCYAGNQKERRGGGHKKSPRWLLVPQT